MSDEALAKDGNMNDETARAATDEITSDLMEVVNEDDDDDEEEEEECE